MSDTARRRWTTVRPDGMPPIAVAVPASLLLAAVADELAKALDQGPASDGQAEGYAAVAFGYLSWGSLGVGVLCALVGAGVLVRHEPRFLVVGLAAVGLASLVVLLLPAVVVDYPLLFLGVMAVTIGPLLFWADREGFFGLGEPRGRKSSSS